MFKFVENFLEKRRIAKEKEEAKTKYSQILNKFLNDGVLDKKEESELEEFLSKNNLSKDDVKEANSRACSLVFDDISSDKRITEEEKNKLEALMKQFNLSTEEFSFDQKSFNKYYTLSLIEKGVLPTPNINGLSVILKDDEIIHWMCHAELKKLKKVTQKINYGGFTGSVKIMAGIRYRVGSINVSRDTREIMSVEDSGNFWLTNQRIGFLGVRKNFSLPYKRILSFELSKNLICIHKDGKENPYFIEVDDVEIPAMIISNLLN